MTAGAARRWLPGLALLFTLHLSPLGVPFVRAQILDDTLAPDSLAEDTVDYTARFLEAQGQVAQRVPVLERVQPPGPHVPFSRAIFTRDSIEWGHAQTVGDLLTQVPGIFVWHGGFIGRPEPINYQARGASSAEYYLDGLPYVAAGVDSVAVDPALLSISFLDRIEVELRRKVGFIVYQMAGFMLHQPAVYRRRHILGNLYSSITRSKGCDDTFGEGRLRSSRIRRAKQSLSD